MSTNIYEFITQASTNFWSYSVHTVLKAVRLTLPPQRQGKVKCGTCIQGFKSHEWGKFFTSLYKLMDRNVFCLLCTNCKKKINVALIEIMRKSEGRKKN